MKKVFSMFSLILLVGLGDLSAQETTKSKQNNSMQRDSSIAIDPNMRIPKDMSADSAMRMGIKMPMDKMSMDSARRMGSRMPMDKMSMDSARYVGSKSPMGRNGIMMADLSTWPEASRMAVEEITTKYGNPDASTDDAVVWMNKGIWKKISIDKKETKHSFPIEHTDMMQTTINYKVPVEKMDELGRFDGSVTFDRTQGTLSARCDKEANNFLALNLAYDIITAKKTVAQARLAYADIIKQKMKGQNPLYLQKLIFTPQEKAADPDINTTGLTKADVMKSVKKTDLKNNK